jgi:hypothetical protein
VVVGSDEGGGGELQPLRERKGHREVMVAAVNASPGRKTTGRGPRVREKGAAGWLGRSIG